MKVNIEGVGELRFWFQRGKGGKSPHTTVNCQIGPKESDAPVWQATAWLAKGDRFEKAVGRRVALTKMLDFITRNRLVLGKEFTDTYFADARRNRGLIWAEYFRQHADLKTK